MQESEVANVRLQLSYCQIAAPVAGRISRKNAEVGQRLSPGQALLAIVPENVWVLTNFKETQLAEIVVGQRVVAFSDAFLLTDAALLVGAGLVWLSKRVIAKGGAPAH